MSKSLVKFRKKAIAIPGHGQITTSVCEAIAIVQKGDSRYYNIVHVESGLNILTHLPKKNAFALARSVMGNQLVREFLTEPTLNLANREAVNAIRSIGAIAHRAASIRKPLTLIKVVCLLRDRPLGE
jgi:hypothetical protein